MHKLASLLVLALVLTLTATANATIYAEVTGGPTPSDPTTYDTYSITLKSTDPNVYITGWGGSFTGVSIEQRNPYTMATIWQDNNPLFTPAAMDLDQDSQFLFLSANVVTVASANSESATSLTADFSFQGGRSSPYAGPSVAIAQVCVPTGGTATGAGGVLYRGLDDVQHDVQLSFPIPEPATLALLGLGGLAAIRRRRR